MSHNPWTRKEIALLAAVVTFAAVLSIGLADPVPHAALGPEWQCSRLAFVFTTCTRIQNTVTASVPVRKEPACRRPPT